MNLFYFIIFMYNFNSITDIQKYDNYVFEYFKSDSRFTSYLIDKDAERIDEPRFKVRVTGGKFKGLSFINYQTQSEMLINFIPLEDGYYYLIPQKMLVRLMAIKSVTSIDVKCDYTCKCDCKSEIKEVVKTEVKTVIKTQREIDWWYVAGGTVLGFIVGGIVGLNL